MSVHSSVRISLSWGELGLLRAAINLKIEEIEGRVASGLWSDPDDLVGGLRRVKAKLDRPVDRLKEVTNGLR